jgi:hypothetical protein
MKLKIIFIGLILLGGFSFSGGAESINELVDQFKQTTDVKRPQIMNDFFGRTLQADATVVNVEEYNFFNEKKDEVYKYYRIITEEQKTPNGTPYQVIFLSKDLNNIKDFKKGQSITKEGKIINIIDERLDISVWLYDGEISAQEKEIFTQ